VVIASLVFTSLSYRIALYRGEFYVAHAEDIDGRIAADDDAAERIRTQIDRRERLLSS